jgi:hypothetical protein
MILEIAVSIGLWLFVGWRFVATIRHASTTDRRYSMKQAWLMWGTYLCVALAATLFTIGLSHEWLTQIFIVGQSLVAIVGNLLLAGVGYETAPHLRRYRRRRIIAGLLTQILCTITLASPIPEWNIIGRLFFAFYLLLVQVRVITPALYHAYRQEEQPLMRLRFAIMVFAPYAVILWMINSLLDNSLTFLHLPYDQNPLYYLSLILASASFVIGYLLSTRFFLRGITFYIYFQNLWTFYVIQLLEKYFASLVGLSPSVLPFSTVVNSPDVAVYRSVMSILDKRKNLLAVQPADALFRFELDRVASPDLGYGEIVHGLRQISFRYVLYRPYRAAQLLLLS